MLGSPPHPSHQVTPLMCLEVVAMLPVGLQGIIRSAGTYGVAVYDELVYQGRIAMYVEVGGGVWSGSAVMTGGYAPLRVPIPHCPITWKNTTTSLTLRGTTLATGGPPPPISEDNDLLTPLIMDIVVVYNCAMSVRLNMEMPQYRNINDPDDIWKQRCLLECLVSQRFKTLKYDGGNVGLLLLHDVDGASSAARVDYCHLGQRAFGRQHKSVSGPILASSVILTGFEHISSLSDFMMWYPEIKTIDLSSLKNVTSIKGDGFLTMCTRLSPTIDLSALSNVTAIEHGFMVDCSGIVTLDLTPLQNVTTIGNRFLNRCTNLTAIRINFVNLVAVGSFFMAGCRSLAAVDLSSTGRLADRGPSFMEGCGNQAKGN